MDKTKKLKVLVPIDFSRYSLETLKFALCLPQWFPTEFTLLHVVPTGEVEAFAQLGEEPTDHLARRRQEALERLEKEVGRIRESQAGLKIRCLVAAGIVFKEICRLAEEENFSLIVIGTHGRTGLSHLLMGSNTERVVQHASCPVLSLKPRVL